MKGRGQVLVFLLVLIPVFITVAGVTFRMGKTLLVHQHLQNHCNKRVLDSLAEQAKGLQALGTLNPTARKVITMRRRIDQILISGSAPPQTIPGLIAARSTLRGLQAAIAARQKAVTQTSLVRSLAVMRRLPLEEDRGKVHESYSPGEIFLPHQAHNSLRLHVIDEIQYQGEVGAPQMIDQDFSQRQKVHGNIVVQTEKYLSRWPRFKTALNMTLDCEAKIEMENLEGKWSGILSTTADRPSSKVSLGPL